MGLYKTMCRHINLYNIKKALYQFSCKQPKKPQHQSYPAQEWTNGADDYKMKPINTSQELRTEILNIIDCIIANFYIIRAG